jgi:hypothetical protein
MNNTNKRFLYLIHTCADRLHHLPEGMDEERDVVIFNWKKESTGFSNEIYLPYKTTIYTGMNIIANYARSIRDQYDYFVFINDDAEIDLDEFEEQVIATGKKLVFPNYHRYLDKPMEVVLESTEPPDHCCISVAADYLDHIVYDLKFDDIDWYAAGTILNSYFKTFCRDEMIIVKTVCVNKYISTNEVIPPYPRIHRIGNKPLADYIESLNYLSFPETE